MAEQKKAISTDSLMVEGRTFPPSKEVVDRAHINAKKYQEMYDMSVSNPDKFWLEQANTLSWFKKPTVTRKYAWDVDKKVLKHTWFKDGELNVSVNCLDRHLNTPAANKIALIWQGEPENDVKKITYKELHAEVCKFANVLKSYE